MAHQMETTTSNYISDSVIDEDIGNGGCADSGYSSQTSLSQASPINVSSLRSSVSHYLQPIYENEPVYSFSSTSELTPTSQNIRKINEFHITSPNLSLKRPASSSLPCTPIKIDTPKKRRVDGRGQSKTYRNLIDNIHVDENSENRDITNFEISPIKAVNVLQERNGKFERKGSFSSTPIYEDSLLKSMSVTKTDFFSTKNRPEQSSIIIRKTKSFSPSKKRLLVTRNREIPFEAIRLPEDIELPSGPVRKPIKRLLSRQNATEEQPTSNLIDITATDLLDSDINIESPVSRKSPSPEVPIKKIRRNLSFNLPQQSPKKELDKIIFAKIPCSPVKQRISATKRSSTAKDAEVAKRPLFDLSPLLQKRESYAHLKYLDILSHLAETTTAVQMILSHLRPKDIYNMYNVCQTWRNIIRNDAFALSQRNKFLSTLVKNKENLQRKPLLRSRSMVATPKSPLKRANSLINTRKNSLRTTPTQLSLDNISLPIQENQRRTKCPVCLRPSIISKNNNTPNANNEKRIPFQRSIYCDKDFFRNLSKKTINQYESAECTKCRFKFCMNCKSEFHGDDKCPVKSIIEPMDSDGEEDDMKMLFQTGSRSKRNLRRLCSLDKVKFSSLN